jgi:Uncharacterized protein conserved in bacteria
MAPPTRRPDGPVPSAITLQDTATSACRQYSPLVWRPPDLHTAGPVTILFLGEIVGKPGVYAVKTGLDTLRERYRPDFIIANGDGATGGFGIGRSHAAYLHKLGINAITSG